MSRLLAPATTVLTPNTQLASWVWGYRPRIVVIPVTTTLAYDFVGNRVVGAGINSGGSIGVSPIGPAWVNTGLTGGGGLTVTSLQTVAMEQMSFVMYCSYNSAGENSLGRSFNGMGRDLYPSNVNRLQFTCAYSSYPQVVDFNFPFDGKMRAIALSHNALLPSPSLPVVYVDGTTDLQMSNEYYSGSYSAAPTNTVSIGNAWNNARCHNGSVALFAAFESVLPTDILQSVSENPLKLFSL